MLIVIDPTARRTDGESVRIARDVLSAGSASEIRVCMLERPHAIGAALARRRGRLVVVVGDDRTLLSTVRALHRDGELGKSPVGMVPVGPRPAVAVARALGVPTDPVAASRAVLSGAERRVDVLADDAGGVVLGQLTIPPPRPAARTRPRWLPLRRSPTEPAVEPALPLRVAAGGRVLADGTGRVAEVAVRAEEGLAVVAVRTCGAAGPLTERAESATVSGPAFRYRANGVEQGPTPSRTWTVVPDALCLAVPDDA